VSAKQQELFPDVLSRGRSGSARADDTNVVEVHRSRQLAGELETFQSSLDLELATLGVAAHREHFLELARRELQLRQPTVLRRTLDRKRSDVARVRRQTQRTKARDAPTQLLSFPPLAHLSPRSSTLCLVDFGREISLGRVREIRFDYDVLLQNLARLVAATTGTSNRD
jgi:hypothetical protein